MADRGIQVGRAALADRAVGQLDGDFEILGRPRNRALSVGGKRRIAELRLWLVAARGGAYLGLAGRDRRASRSRQAAGAP
jgi:hypothetical protein